jgi:hypothetical protein
VPSLATLWLGAAVALSLVALWGTDCLQDLHREGGRRLAVYAAEAAVLKHCIAAAPIIVEYERVPEAPGARASESESGWGMTHTAEKSAAAAAAERGQGGTAKASTELVSFDASGAPAPVRRALTGPAEKLRLLATCDNAWRNAVSRGNSDSIILRYVADPATGLNGALRFVRLLALVILAVSITDVALRLLKRAALPVASLNELAIGKGDGSALKEEERQHSEGGSHIAKMIGTTVVTGITGLSVLAPELVHQTIDTVRTSETRLAERELREHEVQKVSDMVKELRTHASERVVERDASAEHTGVEVRAQLTALAQRVASHDEFTAGRLDDVASKLQLLQANESLRARLDSEARGLFAREARRLAALRDHLSVIDSKVDKQGASTSQALSDLNEKVVTSAESQEARIRSFDESIVKTRRGTCAMLDYSLDVERHSWSPFRGQVAHRQSSLDTALKASCLADAAGTINLAPSAASASNMTKANLAPPTPGGR